MTASIIILAITKIVITSTVVFLGIILLLIALLLWARKKLTPQGKVKITINDDKEIEVEPGFTLLTTLSNQEIYLPSACGGTGTCGACKCQVFEGAGKILPTEVNHLTRREQIDNWRISCQIKLRNDIKIGIPEEIFDIKKWECEVVSNNSVSTYIKELIVKLPEEETLNFRSGGYIQIYVPKCKMWDLKMRNSELIYRAYSMANHPAEGNIIMLNIRIATPPWNRKKNRFKKVNPGICSSYIYSLKSGDKLTISGPYGEFFIKDTEKEIVFIGGGAGMAPMRSHIFHLFQTENTKRKVSFWYGGRSLQELFYTEDFRKIEKEHLNFKYNIALSEPKKEDNWDGATGFIHQVLYDNYLKNHLEPEEIEYYLCGPPLMNEAVIKLLNNLGVPEENIMFDDFGE